MPLRQGREPVGQAQVVQEPQCAGMDRVTAEVTQEVPVFLQDGDLHPGPGQQQSEDHPGGPAAHHTACGPLHLTAPFDVPEAMGTLSGGITP